MKVLITANSHQFYNAVGEMIVRGKTAQGPVYALRLRDGTTTYVREGEFKIVKVQEGA